MIYINTKTGAVIDSPLTISGGDWVVKEHQNETVDNSSYVNSITEVDFEPAKEVDKVDKVEKKSTELTRAEIIQELEAFGIEYNKKATKGELLSLLNHN